MHMRITQKYQNINKHGANRFSHVVDPDTEIDFMHVKFCFAASLCFADASLDASA